MNKKPKSTFDREMLDSKFKKEFESEYKDFKQTEEEIILREQIFRTVINKNTKA